MLRVGKEKLKLTFTMRHLCFLFLLLASGLTAQTPLDQLLDQFDPGGPIPLHETLLGRTPTTSPAHRVLVSHLDSIVVYEYENENFVPTDQTNFFGNDRALDTLSQRFEYAPDGVAEITEDTLSFYDAEDRLTTEIIRSPDLLTGELEPDNRIRYVYNTDSDRIDTAFVEVYFPSEDDYRPRFRQILTYGQDSLVTELLTETYDATSQSYQPTQRFVFTYTPTGQPDSISIDAFIPDNGGFAQSQYIKNYFNDNDLLSDQVLVVENMGSLDTAVVAEVRYFLGTDLQRSLRGVLYAGGSPDLYILINYAYTDALLTSDTSFVSGSGQPGSFDQFQLQRYAYDLQDRLIQADALFYNSIIEGYLPVARTDYFYSEIDVVRTRRPFTNAFDCTFANPFTSGQPLHCELWPEGGPLELRVYDPTGREVLRRPFQNGSSAQLPSGTYLLTLFDRDGGLRWRERVVVLR